MGESTGRWAIALAHVFVRGIRAILFFSGVVLLIAVLAGFPAILADFFNEPKFEWLYSLHVISFILWMGSS